MRNYSAGKPTTGGTPDSKLREAFREKLPKSGGAFFTPEQRHILELFGVIGEILEQVHTKSLKRRKEKSLLVRKQRGDEVGIRDKQT